MIDPENPVLECWACHVLVSVPLDPLSGQPAQYLKCGWCGAVSRLQHDAGQKQQLQQSRPPPVPGRKQQLLQYLCSVWRWLVVALVMVLMLSLVGTGVILLLPRVCSTWATYTPNLLLACMLTMQVLFNYTASVMQPAGNVAECAVMPAKGPMGQVLPGSFDGWSFCRRCQAAKPPAAHHCSTCRKCVWGLDHHCPFINNCVGRGNLRQFLLFLFWAIISSCYMLLMCSLLIWQNWDIVSSSSIAPGKAALASTQGSNHQQHGRRSMDWYFVLLTGVLVMAVQAAPAWLLATYYLVVVSLAVCAAVGLLLLSQLYYLSQGVSYVEYLQASVGSGSTAGSAQRQPQSGRQQSGTSSGHDSEQQQPVAACGCGRIRQMCRAAAVRWHVLNVQLQELYGAGSTAQMVRGLLIPMWQQPQVLVGKKRT